MEVKHRPDGQNTGPGKPPHPLPQPWRARGNHHTPSPSPGAPTATTDPPSIGRGANRWYGLASGEWAAIPEETAAERRVEFVPMGRPTPEEMRAQTETALAEAAAGCLRPVIGQRFPLERAADAHAAIESRQTMGKTLLEVR